MSNQRIALAALGGGKDGEVDGAMVLFNGEIPLFGPGAGSAASAGMTEVGVGMAG